MDHDGILCELVEVWYRANQDGGAGSDGYQLCRANWVEYRQQRVGIVSDGLNLGCVRI